MLRDRRYGGASKATPSTICQKCLKRDRSNSASVQPVPFASLLTSFYDITVMNVKQPHRTVRTQRVRRERNS